MANINFGIDFSKLASALTPYFLRKAVVLSYLTALLKPFENVHTRFINLVKGIRRELLVTSQTLSLQAYLQIYFDNNTILIENKAGFKRPLTLFKVVERQPNTVAYKIGDAGFEELALHKISELNSQIDFVVKYIDGTLSTAQLEQLKFIVEKYVYMDRRWEIQTY